MAQMLDVPQKRPHLEGHIEDSWGLGFRVLGFRVV